jgi:hypothetical protein
MANLYEFYPSHDVYWALKCWAEDGVDGRLLQTTKLNDEHYTTPTLIKEFIADVNQSSLPDWQEGIVKILVDFTSEPDRLEWVWLPSGTA